MKFVVVTLFQEYFTSALATSLLGKAVEAGGISLEFVNPRSFTTDGHQTVDDLPFGGGAGMVMMPEPLIKALEHCNSTFNPQQSIYLSPRGQLFNQAMAARLASLDSLLLLCGRYEGVDQRVIDSGLIHEEISLGDFVLQGGEAAALCVIETISRLVPGGLGNQASLSEESHSQGRLEYPHYTRPRVFRGMEVPEVLLSGNHGKIDAWRKKESLLLTMAKRPDLIQGWPLTREEQKLLEKQP